MICGGSRRSDGSGTHTGFIGKYAAGHTEAHGVHHGGGDRTAESAAYRLYAERHFENHGHACRQVGNIPDDNSQSGNDVKNGHYGYYDLRYFGDRFDAAYDNQQGKEGQNDTDSPVGDGKGFV